MDILRKERDQDLTAAPSLGGLGGREERVTTILGEDTEFNGTLNFTSSLRIEGKFKGKMESEGQLIVAKTGQIEAEIQVGGLCVEGKITGNITARDLVELRATAEVHGDITAARLKIEDGVIFVGHADVSPAARRGNHSNKPAAPAGTQPASQPQQQPAKEAAKEPAKKD